MSVCVVVLVFFYIFFISQILVFFSLYTFYIAIQTFINTILSFWIQLLFTLFFSPSPLKWDQNSEVGPFYVWDITVSFFLHPNSWESLLMRLLLHFESQNDNTTGSFFWERKWETQPKREREREVQFSTIGPKLELRLSPLLFNWIFFYHDIL